MSTLRGKSLVAVSKDVAEGYVAVNPLFLKPFDLESLEALYRQLMKLQVTVRGDKFPHGDIKGIRQRNIRLQRLASAIMILRNYARERGLKTLF